MPTLLRSFRLLWLLALLPLVTGCDSADPDPWGHLDLDAFFAPASQAEVDAVVAQWEAHAAAGAYDANDIEVLLDSDVLGDGSRVLIYRHTTGASNAPHYAMARVPAGSGPFPVVVFNHGGANGFDFQNELSYLADPQQSPFGAIGAQAIAVVPTFRAEPLRNSPLGTLTSGGDESPWDRDVDDAFAALNAAFELIPEADASRVGTIGFSRGATVSMLMAARPLPASAPYTEIRAVVNYFGFTDFLSTESARILGNALLFNDGTVFENLPGVPFLKNTILRPFRDGQLTLAEARLEGIRRSPAFFAARLSPIQSHHHRRDGVVPFDQFAALEARQGQIGVAQFYAYGEATGLPEGQFHSFAPAVMPQSLERTAQFVFQYLFGAVPS